MASRESNEASHTAATGPPTAESDTGYQMDCIDPMALFATAYGFRSD